MTEHNIDEVRDSWHIIWNICWEYLSDAADCNELSDRIDALLEPLLEQARQEEREKIRNQLTDIGVTENVETGAKGVLLRMVVADWQALSPTNKGV